MRFILEYATALIITLNFVIFGFLNHDGILLSIGVMLTAYFIPKLVWSVNDHRALTRSYRSHRRFLMRRLPYTRF